MGQFPNPIGYWLSVRDIQPTALILKELETRNVRYFEAFTFDEPIFIIGWCAVVCLLSPTWRLHYNRQISLKQHTCLNSIAELNPNYPLGIVRFLAEVIAPRDTKQQREVQP